MSKEFNLNCYMDNLTSTCGVGVIYEYSDVNSHGKWATPFNKDRLEGGTGFEIAGFVKSDTCEKAYKFLSKKGQIVFQSPVRENINSGNEFFFVVLDFSKKKKRLITQHTTGLNLVK